MEKKKGSKSLEAFHCNNSQRLGKLATGGCAFCLFLRDEELVWRLSAFRKLPDCSLICHCYCTGQAPFYRLCHSKFAQGRPETSGMSSTLFFFATLAAKSNVTIKKQHGTHFLGSSSAFCSVWQSSGLRQVELRTLRKNNVLFFRLFCSLRFVSTV